MGIENECIECFFAIQEYYVLNYNYVEYYNFLKNIESEHNNLI